MFIHFQLQAWMVILAVWLIGCFIAIITDKTTGYGRGLQGLVLSGIWSGIIMVGTIIYLVVRG